MPFLILRLCVFSLKHNKLVVFTGHGQRFDFLFSASRAKECLLSTCLHNSSAWPINSRAARVAKPLQTVFRQVGIIFDAGCWKLNENLQVLSVALRTSPSWNCFFLKISHSNKLVSRGHLANHGFIKTALKSRWIFVALYQYLYAENRHQYLKSSDNENYVTWVDNWRRIEEELEEDFNGYWFCMWIMIV